MNTNSHQQLGYFRQLPLECSLNSPPTKESREIRANCAAGSPELMAGRPWAAMNIRDEHSFLSTEGPSGTSAFFMEKWNSERCDWAKFAAAGLGTGSGLGWGRAGTGFQPRARSPWRVPCCLLSEPGWCGSWRGLPSGLPVEQHGDAVHREAVGRPHGAGPHLGLTIPSSGQPQPQLAG